MKKNFCMFVLAAAALSMMGLSSCCNDDKEETPVVDPVKTTIYPGGIVLLNVPNEVVSGDTTEIRFRVNPSTAVLTKENFSLDCCASDVYDVQYSDAEKKYLGSDTNSASTRASYVQTSENLSIVDLQNDTINGKTLDGQYVIRVAAQSSRNIIDMSKWALVCSTVDVNGDTANVSSEQFEIKQIPTPQNGVFAWAPQALSYMVGKVKMNSDSKTYYMDSLQVNGTKWYVVPRTYKNALTGAETSYDYDKYVSNAKPLILQDTTSLSCTDKEMGVPEYMKSAVAHAYTAIPETSAEPFASLAMDGDKKFASFTNVLTLTDKYGHMGVWTQPLNYVLATTLNLNLQVPDPVVAGKYTVDNVADFMLSEYGIDVNVIDRYPCRNIKNTQASIHRNIGMTSICGLNSNKFVYDQLTLGAGTNTSVAPGVLFSNIYLTDALVGISDDDVMMRFIQKFNQK